MTWNGLTSNSFWYDNHRLLFNRDSRAMADLPDEYIQMVVTSPPYWGLRKYAGLPDLIWGGKEDCQHEWLREIMTKQSGGTHNPFADKKDWDLGKRSLGYFCSLCGAWEGAYGLEPTPELYVQHTIEILREIRRVLRKDGVVFWNIGDSYSGSWGDSGHRPERDGVAGYQREKNTEWLKRQGHPQEVPPTAKRHPVIKPKDLCLIPFRVAIAAQEDGWWVRSVIIWNKPNPMPESVTDRPSESHEYILMLTKSAKYYYDQEAVREPHSREWWNEDWASRQGFNPKAEADLEHSLKHTRGGQKTWGESYNPNGRNLRSVWTFPTQPYPEAHFATYPEKLVEICVKATTPEVGCCSKCGKPWVRVIEKNPQNVRSHKLVKGKVKDAVDGNNPDMAVGGGFSRTGVQFEWQVQTLGWKPQCKCNAEKVPSIVLDPFAGSGTTLKVAAELNRRAIGYELSEQYCRLAIERNKQSVMG